jgi:superfamily I DNA/RNA helicase/RecB family exonuclease
MSLGYLCLMTEPRFVPPVAPKSVLQLQLSPAQQQLVELPSSLVASVIGSPGSGKTTALKARFLKLVESGIAPERVVVIAATRESANTLRDELALEYQGASLGPLAKTLASLAFSYLVKSRPRLQLLSGSEQDQLLKLIIEQYAEAPWPNQLDAKVRSLSGFRTELRDLIQTAIEHGIEPAELSQLSSKHSIPAWLPAAKCYQSYLEQTRDLGERLDSAMLLREAARAVQTDLNPELRPAALLIDDAQELTPGASEFIYQLASGSCGVMLFGDPDVATLGFRTASPRAMAELSERIAAARSEKSQLIVLSPTHAIRRPEISAAVAKVSSQIEVARAGRQRRGLNPPSQLLGGSAVSVKVYRSESDELAALAAQLRRRHLFDSVPWGGMAVVARSRPQLEQIALRLAAERVPVRIVGSASALRDEHGSGELLRIAHACLKPEELTGKQVAQLLNSEFAGLDQIGLARLRRQLAKSMQVSLSPTVDLLLEAFQNPAALSVVRSTEARVAEKFVRLLLATGNMAKQPETTVEQVLWELVSSSGVLERWRVQSRGVSELAIQAGRNLDSLLALHAAAARYSERNPSGAALDFIEDQLAREVPEDSLARNEFQGDQVALLTPSGLIGRRFDTLALPQLIEGIWPNLKPRSSLLGSALLDQLSSGLIASPAQSITSELSGELRMLNKAIGAATERLLISSSDLEDEQISQFIPLINGSIPETETQLPPRLSLRAMVGQLRREIAQSPSLESAVGLARLAAAGVPGADPLSWYGLLPETTSEPLTDLETEQLVIRPSQLDNYLKCPLHWFLESHGGGEGSFSASLGTLIHEVLELSQSAELGELERLTDSRWHSLEFEANWLEASGRRRASQMLANLAEYLSQFESSGAKVIAREANFDFEFDRIRVRGQVDRIEQLPDGKIAIVDLKTAKTPPSEQAAITNPQLMLYQMALLENGFGQIEELAKRPLSEHELAGAKLLVVGGDSYAIRNQPPMTVERSGEFKKLLLDVSEGMSRPVFLAQLSQHCLSDREYGSCQLQLTRAVSYAG